VLAASIQVLQYVPICVRDEAASVGCAIERVIMHEDGNRVARQLCVELNGAKTMACRGPEPG
jgi:hypothetical protein